MSFGGVLDFLSFIVGLIKGCIMYFKDFLVWKGRKSIFDLEKV